MGSSTNPLGSSAEELTPQMNRRGKFSINGLPKLGQNGDVRVQNFIGSETQMTRNGAAVIGSSQPISQGSIGLIHSMEADLSAYNLNLRLRDMETKLFDMKSSMDRRILQLIEENPQKILDAIKNIETKEASLWFENSQRQQTTDSTMGNLRDQLKKTAENIIGMVLQLQKRVDDVEYKNTTIERSVETVGKHLKASQAPLQGQNALMPSVQGASPGSNELVSSALVTDFKLIRQQVEKEKEARDSFFREMTKNYNDVQGVLQKVESEMYRKMQTQKEELIRESTLTREQIRKLADVRMEKLVGDSEALRRIIGDVESKISEEVGKRLKHDFENKEWVKSQVKNFREELLKEQKSILQTENSFFGQIQESIETLNTIIGNTRDQLEASILSTQTMSNENARNLSSALETVKESFFEKMNYLEAAQNDQSGRLGKTISALNELASNSNARFENEVRQAVQREQRIERNCQGRMDKIESKFEEEKRKTSEWKENIEVKNQELFGEIHGALKTMKDDFVQEKNESDQRFEAIRSELRIFQNKNEKFLGTTRDEVKTLKSEVAFKVNEHFNNTKNAMQQHASSLRDELSMVQEQLDKSLREDLKRKSDFLQEKAEKELRKESDAIRKLFDELRKSLDERQNNSGDEFARKLKNLEKKLSDRIEKEKDELAKSQKTTKENLKAHILESVEEHKLIISKTGSKMLELKQFMQNYTMESLSKAKDEIYSDVEELIKNLEKEGEMAKEESKKLLGLAREEIKMEGLNDREKAALEMREAIGSFSKRLNEINSKNEEGIENVKEMLLERMNQQDEQGKALCRALFQEETVQRLKEDEKIRESIRKNLNTLEEGMKTIIEDTRMKLQEALEKQTEEQNKIIEENRIWAETEFKFAKENLEEEGRARDAGDYWNSILAQLFSKDQEENNQHLHETLLKLEGQLNKDVGEIGDRIDKEVAMLQGSMSDQFSDVRSKMAESDKNMKDRLDQEKEDLKNNLNAIDTKMDSNREQMAKGMQEMEKQLQERRSQDNDRLENEIKERKEADSFLQRQLVELDEFNQAETKALNEKINETGSILFGRIEANAYLEKIYALAAEKRQNAIQKENRKSINRLEGQVSGLTGEANDSNSAFNEFKTKTDENFQVAQTVLVNLNEFINRLDTQVMLDNIKLQTSVSNLEEIMALNLQSMTQDINFQVKQAMEGMGNNLDSLKKELVEDILAEQILKMNQKLEEINEKGVGGLQKSNDRVSGELVSLQKLISENKDGILRLDGQVESHKKRLEEHETDISLFDEGLKALSAQNLSDKLLLKSSQAVFAEEIKEQLLAIAEMLEEIESLKGSGGPVQISGDFDLVIEERIQETLFPMNSKINEIEEKTQKENASVREEMSQKLQSIEEEMKKQINSKAQTVQTTKLISEKLNEFKKTAKIDTMEKDIKELKKKKTGVDETEVRGILERFLDEKGVRGDKGLEGLDVEKLKEIMKDLETDKQEREKGREEVELKIEGINRNIEGVERTVKDEISRSGREGEQQLREVEKKIELLLEKLDTISLPKEAEKSLEKPKKEKSQDEEELEEKSQEEPNGKSDENPKDASEEKEKDKTEQKEESKEAEEPGEASKEASIKEEPEEKSKERSIREEEPPKEEEEEEDNEPKEEDEDPKEEDEPKEASNAEENGENGASDKEENDEEAHPSENKSQKNNEPNENSKSKEKPNEEEEPENEDKPENSQEEPNEKENKEGDEDGEEPENNEANENDE